MCEGDSEAEERRATIMVRNSLLRYMKDVTYLML